MIINNNSYIYNPINFEPLNILPKSLHKWEEDVRWFVHKLYIERVFRRYAKDDFVPLKAEYLVKIISERKYPLIRQALIESGTIISDKYWIKGKKAIGYKLGEKYRNSLHKKFKLSNYKLINRIMSRQVDQEKEITLDTHLHLLKFIQKIEIEYDKATVSIPKNYDIHELAVAMIRDSFLWFKPDPYGRIHTNITNLKSKLRKYLKVNNQKLWNIDIANSQPLFFGIILFYYYSRSNSIGSYNTLPLYIQRRSDILPPDVVRYVELVECGEFYDYVAQEFGLSFEEGKGFKKRLFGEVFFCMNKPYQTKIEKCFSELFPNVYKVIRELKKKDYTFLSKQLQRVESSFVVNTVIRRCMNEYPDMPVFTIHDSVMTTPDNVDIIKTIMMNEFDNYGLKPKLRLETC